MTEWILYPILMHYMSTMALFGMESWRDDGGDDGRGKGAELDAGRWWRMRRKKKRRKKKDGEPGERKRLAREKFPRFLQTPSKSE